MNNRELFKSVWREELIKAHTAKPELYLWPIEELETVVKRMNAAIDRGSFNKDSQTFKAVCKRLKIKHTYRDIETFLGTQGAHVRLVLVFLLASILSGCVTFQTQSKGFKWITQQP